MADERQELLKSGATLFVQGETPMEIFSLNSGSLEVLSASAEFNGLDPSIILSKSRRISVIRGKTVIAGFSSLMRGPYLKSVRALEDSYISRYPLGPNGFRDVIVTDLSMAANILRQLFNRVNVTVSEAGKFAKLYQNICMIGDNLAIVYKVLSGSGAPAALDSKAEMLVKNFSSSAAQMPQQFSAKFLITDNSRYLSRRYEVPGESLDSMMKKDATVLVKKLLQMEGPVFGAVIKSDVSIAESIFEILSDLYMRCLDRIESMHDQLDREMRSLFGGEESLSTYLVQGSGFEVWRNSGRLSDDFVKNLLSLLVKINAIYEEVAGKKLTAVYPGIRFIHQYYTNRVPADAGTVQQPEKLVTPARNVDIGNLKNSLGQIFEFSLVDKEFQSRFLKMLNDFKTSKNPFSTESDGRKMRRFLSRAYWDLYKQVFMRSVSESVIPLPVRLMLNFGYLDEALLEPEQILDLKELVELREKSAGYSIMREPEFLSLIYNGEETPSITEMGLTYESHLMEEEKHKSKKKREEEDMVDSNIKMTMYEIDQRLASTAAVCSGSTATALPILTSHIVRGSLKAIFSTKRIVESALNEVRDTDFSLFYRETVLKIGDAREIIKEEILPHIIILPIVGTRTLLWQELAGTNKRSRGRIVVPIFFMGDMARNMAHTLACFRWELNKTMKGAMWGDPIEGGLTGEYFDYINTYKKNSKLSAEAKEKIKEKFRTLRTDRDRFADDYVTWVMYEKDGIMKLNSAVREMFFKHIPFKKDIRERLENMPAFSQYATRYKNVNLKTVQAYERRFKKYQDEQNSYPREIQNYMDFMLM